MSFKWYVVHVYSGSEKRVKDTIEDQVKAKNMNEYILYHMHHYHIHIQLYL